VNELPDARADEVAGKRTLVVRVGRPRTAIGYGALVVATYVAVALLPAGAAPRTAWLGLVGLPLAVAAARRIARAHDRPEELIPAQAWTLISFLLLAIGLGAGFLLSGRP